MFSVVLSYEPSTFVQPRERQEEEPALTHFEIWEDFHVHR